MFKDLTSTERDIDENPQRYNMEKSRLGHIIVNSCVVGV